MKLKQDFLVLLFCIFDFDLITMKHNFLILIFLTISYLVFSQNLIVHYKIGGYQFGESGEYEKEETVSVYPEKQNFRMDFIQLKRSWIYNELTKKNDSSKTDTLELKSIKIRKSKIENLISELNKQRNNFNYDFIKQNIKLSISKKEIIRITNKKDLFYLIGDEKTKRSDEFDRKN
ncbi:hypothetical protein PQ459_12845 [Chryseobacterium sp. KACC 21268]|nr:hypothetical protein PQ459_12845 [Chryseobacterium sp. KACC 21268]